MAVSVYLSNLKLIRILLYFQSIMTPIAILFIIALTICSGQKFDEGISLHEDIEKLRSKLLHEDDYSKKVLLPDGPNLDHPKFDI